MRYEAGRLDEAATDLDHAVEIDPKNPAALIGRAKGKRFIALAGLERLDYDADPDQVPEESKRSSRKAGNDA